jgi:hypothetical protein
MSRGVIGSFVLVGAGAAALVWAALAAREESRAKTPPVRPKTRAADAAAANPEDAAIAAEPAAKRSVELVDPSGDDYGVIRERIRLMEERLLALDLRRNDLSSANQDLERQVREKSSEASARMMADWRVRSIDTLLCLNAAQRQALTELWTQWGKEDAGRPADRATWLSREVDLRSRLTAEQAAALHDIASTQVRQQWGFMGTTLGSMVGASRDEQTRFQQTLGELPVSNAMLLPEGYGADWQGMMKAASGQLKPMLSTDQQAKLDRMMPR